MPPLPSDRRRRLVAALLLVALAALAVGPGLLPGRTVLPLDILGLFEPWRLDWPAAANPELGDAVLQFSSRVLVADGLKAGHLPLWQGGVMAGHPHVGDTHSSPFYPLLLFLSWCCSPLDAFGWQAWLQMALAGCFMALWMRRLSMGRLPALAAGLAWMLAGVQQVWLRFPPFPGTLCWLTALPLAWEAAWQGGSRRAVAAGALALGLAITAGQLQYVVYGGLLLGLYGAARLAAGPRELRRQGVLAGLGIGALGLALGAVHLLPSYALALETIRPPFTWKALSQTGLPWRQLVTLLAPWFMGRPELGDYRGAQNASELMAYAGLIPLLAGALALALRRDALSRLFAVLAAGVLAIALATPLAWPLAHLPWLQRFGLMRWLAFWPLFLAPLLALALDAAERDPQAAARLRRGSLALGAAGLAFLLLAGRLDPAGRPSLPEALATLAAAVLALTLWAGRPSSLPRGALLIAVLAADLLVFGRGYRAWAPQAQAFPALAPLDRLVAERRREPFRIALFQGGVIALGPSVAPSLGLDEIGGYTSSVRQSYQRFLAALSRPSDNGSLARNPNMVTLGDAAPLLLRLLDVRYVLSAEALPAWERPLDPAMACRQTRRLEPGVSIGVALRPWADGLNRLDVAVARGGTVALHLVAGPGSAEHLAYGELAGAEGPLRSLYFQPIPDSADRPYHAYLDLPTGATGEAPEVCVDGDALALGLAAAEAPYQPTFEAHGLRVHRAPPSPGRAWLVPEGTVAADLDAVLRRLSQGGITPERELLLEAPQVAAAQAGGGLPAPVTAERPSDGLAGLADRPTVSEEGPNRRSIRLPAGGPAWLVVSEAWDAGWRARLDGLALPVLRADGALIAVPLPPRAVDAARLELRYRPTAALVGAGISALALAAVAILWLSSGGQASRLGPAFRKVRG